MKTENRKAATAFAPATVGNMAVGFDILGFAVEGIGDRVQVERISDSQIQIADISGVVSNLPMDPSKNTASRSLFKMKEDLSLPFGFRISIQKGIPLASGMGGSAASAVGAVVAANSLLDCPLKKEELLKYALAGENLTAGQEPHADNIGPCLLGGIQLTCGADSLTSLSCPPSILCVLVHPEIQVETKAARALLNPQVSLQLHTQQSALLGGFLIACLRNDLHLMKTCMSDIIIEPQRQHLVPGFQQVKQAALDAGAIGCSLSGSGPSVFAWVDGPSLAHQVKEAMLESFFTKKIKAQAWISPISQQGAVVLS